MIKKGACSRKEDIVLDTFTSKISTTALLIRVIIISKNITPITQEIRRTIFVLSGSAVTSSGGAKTVERVVFCISEPA